MHRERKLWEEKGGARAIDFTVGVRAVPFSDTLAPHQNNSNWILTSGYKYHEEPIADKQKHCECQSREREKKKIRQSVLEQK